MWTLVTGNYKAEVSSVCCAHKFQHVQLFVAQNVVLPRTVDLTAIGFKTDDLFMTISLSTKFQLKA